MKILNSEKTCIEKVICNCCGKEITVENGIIKEGVMSAEINWGYFSNNDGENHKFDLCESCYWEIIKNFKIPVEKGSYTEML